MPNPTVAYFYDPDVGNFHYGKLNGEKAPITDNSKYKFLAVALVKFFRCFSLRS